MWKLSEISQGAEFGARKLHALGVSEQNWQSMRDTRYMEEGRDVTLMGWTPKKRGDLWKLKVAGLTVAGRFISPVSSWLYVFWSDMKHKNN